MDPGRCAVIGAGLAGAAVAASLARRGWQVDVFEAAREPASGASGLPVGLMAPALSPDDNLLSRLTRAGIDMTLRECGRLLQQGRDWLPSGVLERRIDDPRPPPPAAVSTKVDPDGNWWHANGAWIRPGALVAAWLREPGVRFLGGQRVSLATPEVASADLIVVAAALGSRELLGGRIELNPVRGQVSWSDELPACAPPHPVNGNGHFVVRGDIWLCGSTYGRGDESLDERDADHAANLEKLRVLLPGVAESLAPQFENGRVRAWTGVRCTSRDRRPVAGQVDGKVWVSTAMGSRGLTFCMLCAELVAVQVHGGPWPVDEKLGKAVAPARFAGFAHG